MSDKKPSGIFITEFEGYTIYYQKGNQQFVAYDKENKQIANDHLQEKLQDKIKRFRKQTWTPIEVIHRDYGVVKITSRDADRLNEAVWISFKDENGEACRQKEGLYSWRDIFYEKTPQNLTLLDQVQTKKKQKKILSDEIIELENKFTKPYKLPEVAE